MRGLVRRPPSGLGSRAARGATDAVAAGGGDRAGAGLAGAEPFRAAAGAGGGRRWLRRGDGTPEPRALRDGGGGGGVASGPRLAGKEFGAAAEPGAGGDHGGAGGGGAGGDAGG